MSDALLAQQLREGDRAAFARLVEEHERAIYGYLRARIVEASDAEDLTQETFLRAYIGRAKFDDSTLIRPWLLGIARNLLREHARKAKRRKEVAWTAMCLELDEATPPQDRSDDRLEQLPSCLETLTPGARQALEMRYASQMRVSQIGDRLKRSEAAVRVLMCRARQALKSCLVDKGRAADD